MGLPERFDARRRPASPMRATGKVVIDVREDTHTYEGDDGEAIWCGGYAPTDAEGFFLGEAGHQTSDPRAFFCHVAGVTYRPEALAESCFAHGAPVALRAEPHNPNDADAVAVYDASGEIQVGYVPATLAPKIASIMRTDTRLVGFVLSEYRAGSPRGERLGIHIAILPAGEMELSIHDD